MAASRSWLPGQLALVELLQMGASEELGIYLVGDRGGDRRGAGLAIRDRLSWPGWVGAQRRASGRRVRPEPAVFEDLADHVALLSFDEADDLHRRAALGAPKRVGRFLHAQQPDKNDREAVEALVTNWYHEHAVRLFEKHLHSCLTGCKSLAVRNSPRLTVRQMTRRWGSCTKAGNISLNVDLIKTPIHCIDYVIVHELCHLRIHNHSPAFYRLLSQCMPDWEKRKERLDAFRLE